MSAEKTQDESLRAAFRKALDELDSGHIEALGFEVRVRKIMAGCLDAECPAKENAQESEYEDRRLELLRIFKAYERHVGNSELALRLMFIEAQYQLKLALAWPRES